MPETDSRAPNEVDLREFYEAFPYPPEERNLDHFADGSQVVEGSPRHWFHLYFPDRPYTGDIDVLVAGCGTCQAARFSVLKTRGYKRIRADRRDRRRTDACE